MAASIVSAKGWIVIPKEIREKYGLTAGKKVQVMDLGGSLILVPIPDDPVAALHGMLAGGSSLTEELVEEHRRELEEEDRYFEQHVRSR